MDGQDKGFSAIRDWHKDERPRERLLGKGPATLTDVDLRGSRIGIARGWDRLRGATIDHGQLIELAPDLAAQWGLTVAG